MHGGKSMKERRFDKVCAYLCKLLERKEPVPEDVVADYITELEKAVRQQTHRQNYDFHDLTDMCRKFHMYQADENEQRAYALGSIWGASELYKEIFAGIKKSSYETRSLAPDTKLFHILKVIAEHPGITRKELLDLFGKSSSESALSHNTGTLEKRGYISPQKIGQEKIFYASVQGDELVASVNSKAAALQQEQTAALQEQTAARQEQAAALGEDAWKEVPDEILEEFSDNDLFEDDLFTNSFSNNSFDPDNLVQSLTERRHQADMDALHRGKLQKLNYIKNTRQYNNAM